MSHTTVRVRATRESIRQAMATIPKDAVSRGVAVDAMMTRCGMVILGRIRKAFVAKARGGTDEAGQSWAPLSRKTIAYSRRGRTRTEIGRKPRPSQALTSRQQDRWWDLYRQGLAMFNRNKGSAARRAWAILKGEGAKTLLDKYGNRQVEILRDTGLLLNSLSPGSGSAEQIFRVGAGEVIVGTNRKGAKFHHEGVLGRLPQRKLWPDPDDWPVSWWEEIEHEVKQGIIDITINIIRDVR